MSEQKPNWAELLADCEINKVFADLIKTVKQDANTLNDLPHEKRRHYKYACTEWPPEEATVFRTGESGHGKVTPEKIGQTVEVILNS